MRSRQRGAIHGQWCARARFRTMLGVGHRDGMGRAWATREGRGKERGERHASEVRVDWLRRRRSVCPGRRLAVHGRRTHHGSRVTGLMPFKATGLFLSGVLSHAGFRLGRPPGDANICFSSATSSASLLNIVAVGAGAAAVTAAAARRGWVGRAGCCVDGPE